MRKIGVRQLPRYSFAVDAEITDLQSKMEIREKTKDLSLVGCGIATSAVLPHGTKVRIKLVHGGEEMTALAQVIYARSDVGMGVAFFEVTRADARVLEGWLDGLSRPSVSPAAP